MMKFLTLTNSGGIDLCRNMLKSAELVGIDPDDFVIACLDKRAYEQLMPYSGAFLYRENENNNLTEFQDWSDDPSSGFQKIVRNKWKLIRDTHDLYKDLCWVDTDIVFKNNVLPYIENSDYIIFQSDLPTQLICSGFMVFNSTNACQLMINECVDNLDEDDQNLINRIALKFLSSVIFFNQDLFPNGHIYYKEERKQSAVIVHNNHMIGIEEKIKRFKEEKLWFI